MLDEVHERRRRVRWIPIWQILVRYGPSPVQGRLTARRRRRGRMKWTRCHGSPLRKPTRLDAASWAELVARSLNSRHPPAATIILIAFIFVFIGNLCGPHGVATPGRPESRRHGGDAGRMHAFARLLVARSPGQPVAHLAVSGAWGPWRRTPGRVDDLTAVERNWRLALGQKARRTLVLDPQHARAAS